MLGALASDINADSGSPVTAVADGGAQTLTLTAKADNTSFTLSAISENVSDDLVLQRTGDYALVLPNRTAGAFAMSVTGDLSVVALSVFEGDTINLASTGGDVVVVADLDVGLGTVEVSATGGVALGGTVTASNLTVTAALELTVDTFVSSVNVTMTGNGDFALIQEGDGTATDGDADLIVETLTVAGGDAILVVDGDVTLNAIEGTGGVLTIMATGNVTFADTTPGAFTSIIVEAGGTVSGTIDTAALSIDAGGAVTLSNEQSVTVSQLDAAGDAISLTTAGALTLNADVQVEGNANLSLASSTGAVTINTGLTSATGTVAVSAFTGLTLAPSASIDSTGNAVTLSAGGAFLMDADTFVRAGAGTVALTAGVTSPSANCARATAPTWSSPRAVA